MLLNLQHVRDSLCWVNDSKKQVHFDSHTTLIDTVLQNLRFNLFFKLTKFVFLLPLFLLSTTCSEDHRFQIGFGADCCFHW